MRYRGMTLLEVMMAMLVLSIMASIAMPMYADYTRKSRTAEVPTNLKSLAQTQLGFYEAEGRYASELLSLGWTTSKGLTQPNVSPGSFYLFSVANTADCDPGSGGTPVPDGLAMAVAMDPLAVPTDYVAACMNIKLEMRTNN